jgi:peptidoglycan/LPS O-acetylase OafA/YrhL
VDDLEARPATAGDRLDGGSDDAVHVDARVARVRRRAPAAVLGHRPELDGLRGIAVTLVVVFHAGRVLGDTRPRWAATGGFLGVDLFFVLSGFLITVLLLDEADRRGRVSLGGFAVRRGRRLLPALVALVAAAAVLAAGGWAYGPDVVRSSVLPALTFTSNEAMIDGGARAFPHLWSLAIEGQFYVLWAVVVALAVRAPRPHAVLAGLATAGIVAVGIWRLVRFEQGDVPYFLYMGTATRLDAPLAGTLVGVAWSTGALARLRGPLAARVAMAGLAVVLVWALVLPDPFDPRLYHGVFSIVAVAAGAAVIGAVRAGPGPLTRVLAWRPLAALGIVSYSLYLWHLPVFEVLRRNTPAWSPAARAVVAVPVALALAVASYRVVERPLAKAKQRSSSEPNAYTL